MLVKEVPYGIHRDIALLHLHSDCFISSRQPQLQCLLAARFMPSLVSCIMAPAKPSHNITLASWPMLICTHISAMNVNLDNGQQALGQGIVLWPVINIGAKAGWLHFKGSSLWWWAWKQRWDQGSSVSPRFTINAPHNSHWQLFLWCPRVSSDCSGQRSTAINQSLN